MLAHLRFGFLGAAIGCSSSTTARKTGWHLADSRFSLGAIDADRCIVVGESRSSFSW
jgi:Flp pilus assembly CpaE family ATPase